MSLIKTISLSVSHVGLFWQDRVNGQIFRWNIIFILSQLAILFVKFNNLPPQIPLFYSLPWGDQELAPVSSVFILPVISIVIMLLNNFLAVYYLKSIQLLSRALVIVSLICSVFAAVTVFQIINLVS